ncbi:beta-N-acetylhexosaminidase, partial [Pseudoxanthomonas sp. SGD-10]
LTAQQQKFILGVQANMWTEYISTEARVEYMLFPRLMALSEIAWTMPANKNFKNFNEERLPIHLGRLDETTTQYRVPSAIGAKDTSINVSKSYTFHWKAPIPGARIHYTIDGTTPDETTPLYEGSLEVFVPEGEYRIVKSIVITPSNRKSEIITTKLTNRKPFEAVANATGLTRGALRYYYVPGKFETTVEIDTNLATRKGLADGVSIHKVPNKAREYGLVFSGYINVNEDAEFEFSLLNNDGARLYINDELIIENDGRIFQYERSAAVHLRPGLHKIRVAYFDVGPASIVRLYVKGTDGKKIEVPSVMLYH